MEWVCDPEEDKSTRKVGELPRRFAVRPHRISCCQEHESPLVYVAHITRSPLPITPWSGSRLCWDLGRILAAYSFIRVTYRTFPIPF